MAPGTTAKRLLAKPAKTTSAGVFLALVVAALVLGGCGGGSAETSDSTTTSSSGSTAASADPSSDATGGIAGSADVGSEAKGPSAGDVSGGGAPAAGDQPSAGGTHGPGVPQPKGEPEPGITPQQRREATVASMTLESPSSQPSSGGPRALPAEYTCDGKGTSPALRWQGVPEGSGELVLFVMNAKPTGGQLFFDWAVAGLSPGLEEIEAGKLPGGAVVGRNSFGKAGYEICPEGGGETFIFTLFALPEKLSPGRGFDPLALRREVAAAAGNVGLLALSYLRG